MVWRILGKEKIFREINGLGCKSIGIQCGENLKESVAHPPYTAEFPPEDVENDEEPMSMRSEEEDALALILVNDLVLKKKDISSDLKATDNEAQMTKTKKIKCTEKIQRESLKGNFGTFTIEHNSSKGEEVGHHMPPTSK